MTTTNQDAPGLQGIWPALMTPLTEALAIDDVRFAAHARALLDAGCAGVTPFGTTGEGPSFSVAERRDAVNALVAGGVPASRILVSVSCAAVPDTLALTRHAQDIGAWGVLLMPPFFFKGVSDEGIVESYRQLLDATADRPLRVVLYHIPQVSAVGLSHGVIAELLRRWPQRIVAIKDSACERAASLELARAFMSPNQPQMGVHVGNELDLPALAARGSRGAVSGLANFMPRTVHRLATEPDAAKRRRRSRACRTPARMARRLRVDPGAQGDHGRADWRQCLAARARAAGGIEPRALRHIPPRTRGTRLEPRHRLTTPPPQQETPTMTFPLLRRALIAATAAACAAIAAPAFAQTKIPLRISTPAVPDDWHGKMWTVFKESLDKSAPGEFDVQINLNASLFKQGTEPAAMARGNLELSSISAFDIAKIVPEFSIFTAGYIVRDPQHQQKVFAGPVGKEMFKLASEKMEVTILTPIYLGTRQVNLREVRNVKTPADLKGVKLRMPGSKEWLFLGEALGATATPLAFGEVYLGLKTGTIDGQDNPLPSVRAAKFYEVTKQIVMTNHLVDGIFIAIADKTWKALTPAQQAKVQAAADAAAAFNNDNRLKEEAQIVDFFKKEGLTVTTPDVEAFRKSVQAAYATSDMAKTWPAGMLDRINNTK